MLTKFRIQNFKNLVDVYFEPQLLNAVIGQNNSGKTSLLQSIDFLRSFFMSSVEVYLKDRGWELDELPYLRQTERDIKWDVTAELEADELQAGGKYEYSISLSPRHYLGIGSEKLTYTRPGGGIEVLLKREGTKVEVLNRKTGKRERGSQRFPASVISTYDPDQDRENYPELLRFRAWVEHFRYFFSFDPKIIRSRVKGKYKDIGPSGEHFASWLANLKDQNPKKFEKLIQRIRRLFPNISDISIIGEESRAPYSLRLHERESDREVIFSSAQMSEGVLRLLTLASLLYVESESSLFMFEEPEVSLHPQLVREVVQMLRELTLRKPPNQNQVIFTTHSPYILDEFYDHPEEVFILERPRPQEGASLVPLKNVKQLAKVKEVFPESLGEAWFSGLIGGKSGVKPL